MIFRQLFHQETCTYTYLLADELSREAVLIDPVIESVERDLRLLDELGLKLVYSLDTHVHADHITASGLLRERTGARSGVAAQAGVACADQQLAHGDRLAFGRYELEVRSTPGHTAGCVTYVLDEGSKMMPLPAMRSGARLRTHGLSARRRRHLVSLGSRPDLQPPGRRRDLSGA